MLTFIPMLRSAWPSAAPPQEEVVSTVLEGEEFPAKFGRSGFRRNFVFQATWRGRYYDTKQVEAYAVRQPGGWLVLTVITRYF